MMLDFAKLFGAVLAIVGVATACNVVASPAEVTVGRCRLPDHLLATIVAKGECPDGIENVTCQDETPDCSGSCDGVTYNPHEACVQGCNDCQNACDAAARQACGENETCFQIAYDACAQHCDCDCSGEPDQDRKSCINDRPSALRLADSAELDNLITEQAEFSEYVEIPWKEVYCMERKTCADYCRYNSSPSYWYCDYGAYSWVPDGAPYKQKDGNPTPGECPLSE